ncbi:MAG: COX15/CtaA family protein [Candidatus Zixiibacteriota bacterium]|nr:MAG: COX15/CtaA family protein [candidate division Zixibacteria bacterium]
MRAFGRFAILTTVATYFLIFMGGLVRVSGAGLGCPDWPKCFGRWIPPLSINQIPPDIDAAAFNLTLAWIEYINRLFGVTVGLLILAVAIWAIARYRSNLRIVIPAVLAAILTAYQGWQGSQVVSSGLKPIIVSVHMIIALVIAGLMIYISIQAYYRTAPDSAGKYPKKSRLLTGILLLAALVQVIIGTQLREAIENIFAESPLISSTEVLFRIGGLTFIHAIFGIVIMFLAFVTSYRLLSRDPSSLIWQSGWTMAGLGLLQIIFGIVLFLSGIPPVVRLLHMWISALLFGVVLITYFALKNERSAA